MNGQPADYFIGGLSIALGAGLMISAAFQWERAREFRKAQWLENRLGEGGARLTFAALGLFLVGLGFAIASGFAPNATRA